MARLATSDPLKDGRNQLRRITLDFSPDALDKVTQLRRALDAKSSGDVIRKGLQLLDWYVTTKRQGHIVKIVKDGKEIEIELDL